MVTSTSRIYSYVLQLWKKKQQMARDHKPKSELDSHIHVAEHEDYHYLLYIKYIS